MTTWRGICAKIAVDGVYYSFYCTHSGNGTGPNEMRPPMSAGAFGGMPTQGGQGQSRSR